MNLNVPLYGAGMHEFILREIEIGRRAAACEDSEYCGWSALDDLSYEEWMKDDAARRGV